MPLVSVIMPVYNQKPSFLCEAIESILKQTLKEFELIIIDDCSTEKKCLDILEKYKSLDSRIIVIRNKNNYGVAKSLNIGIARVSSPIIARMDSDDISLPERLLSQYTFLQQNPDVQLIGCQAKIIDENNIITGIIRVPLSTNEIRSSILVTNPLIHPTWMFRKKLIDVAGEYSLSSPSTEDYEFLLRIAQHHKIENLPKILFYYRFNPNGVSFKKNKFQEKESLKIRWKALINYDYPFWHIYKIMPSLFFFLFVPSVLKKQIIKFKTKYD